MRHGVAGPILAIVGAASAQEDEAPWKILSHEPLELTPHSGQESSQGRIDALIEDLRKLDGPRHGIQTRSGGGTTFEPLSEGPADAFRELVRLGPAAIPALLEHLDDGRTTRLKFGHLAASEAVVFGGTVEVIEVPVPYGRERERRAVSKAFGGADVDIDYYKGDFKERGELSGHAVTVGDCCFAILGQIANRPYEAVRYQPTMIVAVSSPTREPRIAKALRAAWGGGDPRRRLAASLMDDLHTRGAGSSYLQAGAAARLLAYFPEPAGPIVAGRIAALQLDDADDQERWKVNQIHEDALLYAVVKSGHPLVRAEWLKLLDLDRPSWVIQLALDAAPRKLDAEARRKVKAVLEGTREMSVVLLCLHLLPDERSDALFDRLEHGLFLAAETKDYRGGRHILRAMARINEERALPVFERYAKAGLTQRLNALSALHGKPKRKLVLAVAPPLLDDPQKIPRVRVAVPAGVSAFFGHRVCDWAAQALAQVLDDVDFDIYAPVEERDQKIAAIRTALKKKR
ncbi:MAG: hypothetical protein ACE5JG_02035 [Planctomycetota bacterium]